MITIASPNTDRTLLTLAELRAAAGVSDSSKDAVLRPLGGYVAAMITKACGVIAAGATPPTLRLETVSEAFSFKSEQTSIVLSRRPVTEIASITEVLSVLDASEYQLDGAAGILYRVSGSARSRWLCGETVVEYSAGYETVPDDLKYAAMKFVQAELLQAGRDPMLRSKTTEGVSSYEWWVDPTKDTHVPPEVLSILNDGGYINKGGWMA